MFSMKIGIDIDEIIAEQLDELVKFYYKRTGKLIPKNKFHSYYWPDVWNIPLEEAKQIDKDFKNSEHYENILPVKDSVRSINYLVRKNELIIITSRPVIFKEKTTNWIRKHLGEFPIKIIHSDEAHKVNSHSKKSDICLSEGIKIMVEDDLRYAKDCAENGIRVILFDKPWNKNFKHKNVIRVKSWKEALVEINLLK